MDFSPVYRCMHIYTVLREGETFKAYYRQQRKQQARLVLQPPINMVNINFHKNIFCILNFCSFDIYCFQHESINGYQTYLQGIVGFFVVEDHILNTGNGLATRTYLDELWQMALSKIVNALRTHSVSNKDILIIFNKFIKI